MALDRQQMRRRQTDDTSERLALLGDEYAREVLEAVAETSRSGSEVAAATSVSKPTAFRRLNRLEDAGLVESRQAIDLENGQHYQEFRAAFDRVSVRLEGEGLTADVDRCDDGIESSRDGERRRDRDRCG